MDLLTPQDVERALELSEGSMTASMKGLITSVSAKLAVHCGRDDWGPKQERTEYHDGGRSFINLRYWPVDTAATLTVNDDVIHDFTDETLVDSDLYFVDSGRGVISAEGWTFGSGTGRTRSLNTHRYNFRALKVVYTGGYDQDEIPVDLKRAALLQYEREYDVRYRSGSRQGERPGMVEVLPEVVEILRKYVRRDLFS